MITWSVPTTVFQSCLLSGTREQLPNSSELCNPRTVAESCLLSWNREWLPNSSELSMSHSNYQYCLMSGSDEYAWDLRTGRRLACGSDQSACSTGRRAALGLPQLVRPHELFKETEQPPAGSLIINDSHSSSLLLLWNTQQVLLTL